ncbi:unnamed protein product [Eruca vesicaria subsp. sativa]|uniref:Uncharacterized protein n=1 Tax=Eruca vesicaria subsp. sativa TaxID=29727 RepID=A0ABC8JFM3_ERUVS|nr:unnamed protein product [Eruca vesicaria subsp. sativa]
MAMAQKDRNTRMAQRAFEMVDKVYGRSQKLNPPVLYVPRDEPAPRFNQNSYEYGGPKVYTVKEGTNTTSCRRVIYQYSKESTTKEPVVSLPTEHIRYFGGVRPKGRAISCDEAVQLYGGVLIKEYRK